MWFSVVSLPKPCWPPSSHYAKEKVLRWGRIWLCYETPALSDWLLKWHAVSQRRWKKSRMETNPFSQATGRYTFVINVGFYQTWGLKLCAVAQNYRPMSLTATVYNSCRKLLIWMVFTACWILLNNSIRCIWKWWWILPYFSWEPSIPGLKESGRGNLWSCIPSALSSKSSWKKQSHTIFQPQMLEMVAGKCIHLINVFQ